MASKRMIAATTAALSGALGLAACTNHTPVRPTPNLSAPPPPTVYAVPSMVHIDPETNDQISVTRGIEGTEVRNRNATSGREYVVTTQVGDPSRDADDPRRQDSIEMYSSNKSTGQNLRVSPTSDGGMVVEGVDKKSGRYWEVIDPEGKDGPNFIAADPANNNIYSVTTEPDGHGDKTRQNDFATPSDYDIRSRIAKARSGLPRAKTKDDHQGD